MADEPITKHNVTPEEREHITRMLELPELPPSSMINCATGRSISKDQAMKIFLDDKSISFGTTSHYNQYRGFEVIDVCEQLRSPDGSGNFNRGNAFKYLARAGWKNSNKEVEDLEKAVNYIQREIDRLKGAGAYSSETEKLEKAKASMKQWFKDNPCPTCSGVIRITVGTVCRTCGRDYSNGEIGEK